MAYASTSTAPTSKGANIGIWVAQVLGAGLFIMSGVMKTMTPISELSAMMPWAGEYSATFVRFIGVIDIAGGLGLLLPSLTRIMPRLTVIAAAACVLLQILAIGFHAMRGEFEVLPLNAVYIALALIVLWGRGRKAPIAPRS
ncbi:DoxX family protein [Alloyangia pacifica]|uniref:DoxX family protein n=1 Tax=Alloyangia pacifica TaxID=311180 RepID=UPI001CD7E4AA|nr:DoxX family protein [Alloyangia pacifica]MCA0998224.1 DoxX family protein [Alloyangia pacifica]